MSQLPVTESMALDGHFGETGRVAKGHRDLDQSSSKGNFVSRSIFRFSGFMLSVVLMGFALPAFADGESTYKANCASCHGANGSGKTSFAAKARVPDLRTREVQDMSDDEMYSSIARGTRHKIYPHGYELRGMSKTDIKAIVAYIRTLK